MPLTTNHKEPSKTFDGVAGNQSPRQSPAPQSPQGQPHHNPPHVILLDFNDILAALNVGWRIGARVIREPWFPKPIQLGLRCRRWIRDEVVAALATGAYRESNIRVVPEDESARRKGKGWVNVGSSDIHRNSKEHADG